MTWRSIEWQSRRGVLRMLDQTRLPGATEYIEATDYREVAEAICNLRVRGAPLIGIAAAYGVVLGAREFQTDPEFNACVERVITKLAATRPTAVNLFWALNRQKALLVANWYKTPADVLYALETEAVKIEAEDAAVNRKIGEQGAALFSDGMGVLTHCNTGALATSAHGTALAAIREAIRQGKKLQIYADETRPLLQGARLTVWELMQDGIPVTLITDNMAAMVMQQGKVQAVITGADRIAANGDAANKIGTYGLAILAREHRIPFYIAAPLATIDLGAGAGGSNLL
jgi:methylthioribose-1-phosphate isomerase